MSEVEIRFLGPSEAEALTDLITQTYGSTYDAEWVYQPDEIARRISDGRLISTVGVIDGEIAGHVALTREEENSPVLHSGVAVVTEAARGQHLFTRLKDHAAKWANQHGVFGIFSEATAAHPYSQKANIDLGAHETGFLLGWIPASVTNNAAVKSGSNGQRQSVALFYLKTNEAHTHPIFAPAKYHDVIDDVVKTSGLRGKLTKSSRTALIPDRTEFAIVEKEDHNLSVIAVSRVGADLMDIAQANHNRLLGEVRRDAVYLDLPLNQPATEIVLDQAVGKTSFSFAGIFPNRHLGEDVLRLQSLPNVEIKSDDVSTASDHGSKLLAYVLDDLRA